MYTGISKHSLTDKEWNSYLNGNYKFQAKENQYLILKYDDKVKEIKKRIGGELVPIRKKLEFKSKHMGNVKPRNLEQKLYFDLLLSKAPLVLVSSRAGCGKTFLATCYAMSELDKGSFKKIVFTRNNIQVQGIGHLGAVPGTKDEKLSGYAEYVSDIIDPYAMERYKQEGKIEFPWLGDMRGRSISDSIVIVSEAQNLSPEHVKMVISRMGENSRLIFDFDLEQIDNKSFEKNNGMLATINALAGHELFGMVQLEDVERSELAKLASLIK